MAQSNFTAGGGNAAVQKLKKLDQYRNADAATLRRIIEQRGARILSGKRGSEARSMNSDQAYKAGGGNAGAAKMRENSANRNMSQADLRRLVEQKGRNAVKGGPSDKPNVPAKKSNLKGVSSTNDIARLRREQEAARQAQLAKAERKSPAPKPPSPKAAGTQPSRPAATRPATPAAPKKPATPASPKDRRVSASTANRESGNYGTSRTNNPMIDDWMRQKMREREGRDLTSKGSDYGSKAMSKQFASKGASTDTGYTTKTKADGSKYAGKQPTNQTKAAYDSKTNLKPSAPSKPATPNKKPDVKYKPSTKVDGSKYSGKKPENRAQLAFKSKGAESLAEMMRKRRQGQ